MIAHCKKKNIRQNAYLQSWKYFQNGEKEIREQFVFPASGQEKAQRVINIYTSIYTAKRGRVQNLQTNSAFSQNAVFFILKTFKLGKTLLIRSFSFRTNIISLVFAIP
jgi:hypothetical protein